jgi:phospholipase/carboxylesterase
MLAESRLNRRSALLLGVAACALACRQSKSEPPSAAGGPSTGAPGPAPRAQSEEPLGVVALGPLKPEERGGQLVVLLHGWGAHGDDLVSFARSLAQPTARFLVPAAPLPQGLGGRAWWRINEPARPPLAASDELPEGHQPNPQVTASRRAVQALLRDAKQRYAPESIALAGFSQGAMLSLDVAIAADPPVDKVAVLSGALLADSLPALRAQPANAPRPLVLVSHGRSDPVLPFRGAQSIATVLEPRGYRVTWVPFDGGHEISPLVVAKLREFLFGAGP